jgi:hypothetical protein
MGSWKFKIVTQSLRVRWEAARPCMSPKWSIVDHLVWPLEVQIANASPTACRSDYPIRYSGRSSAYRYTATLLQKRRSNFGREVVHGLILPGATLGSESRARKAGFASVTKWHLQSRVRKSYVDPSSAKTWGRKLNRSSHLKLG